jgi:hypothetical protein
MPKSLPDAPKPNLWDYFQRVKAIPYCELSGKRKNAVEYCEGEKDDPKHKCRTCAHLKWVRLYERQKSDKT